MCLPLTKCTAVPLVIIVSGTHWHAVGGAALSKMKCVTERHGCTSCEISPQMRACGGEAALRVGDLDFLCTLNVTLQN